MPVKPSEIKKATIHTYWDFIEGLICLLSSTQLRHEFNNGGKKIIFLKGSIWVVTNYYSCINPKCEMHGTFLAVYHSAMHNILANVYHKKIINVRTIPSDLRGDHNSFINILTGVGYKHLGVILYFLLGIGVDQS